MNLHLLQRGVATLRGGMFVFSSAHSKADVEATLEALEVTLDAMTEEESIPDELLVTWARLKV